MRIQELIRTGHCGLLAAVTLVCACVAQPRPDMTGAKRTEVTRDGVGYVVLQQGDVVEVRRRTAGPSWKQGRSLPTVIDLIAEIGGCPLRKPTLEQGETWFRGRVDCS